jgi:hypothetical protein
LKSNDDKVFPSFRPFWMGNMSKIFACMNCNHDILLSKRNLAGQWCLNCTMMTEIKKVTHIIQITTYWNWGIVKHRVEGSVVGLLLFLLHNNDKHPTMNSQSIPTLFTEWYHHYLPSWK